VQRPRSIHWWHRWYLVWHNFYGIVTDGLRLKWWIPSVSMGHVMMCERDSCHHCTQHLFCVSEMSTSFKIVKFVHCCVFNHKWSCLSLMDSDFRKVTICVHTEIVISWWIRFVSDYDWFSYLVQFTCKVMLVLLEWVGCFFQSGLVFSCTRHSYRDYYNELCCYSTIHCNSHCKE